jgi:hypothetical protein
MPAAKFVDMLQRVALPTNITTRPLPAEAQSASIPKGLMEATFIYLRKDGNRPSLAQLYEGPFTVVARNKKVFRLQMGTREVSVSIDLLKPHLGAALVKPAVPASRGRPPGVPATPEAQGTPASVVPEEENWTLVVSRRHKKKK